MKIYGCKVLYNLMKKTTKVLDLHKALIWKRNQHFYQKNNMNNSLKVKNALP